VSDRKREREQRKRKKNWGLKGGKTVGFRTRNRGKASAKPRQKTREENQSKEERKSRAQIQSNNTPRTGGTGAKPRGKKTRKFYSLARYIFFYLKRIIFLFHFFIQYHEVFLPKK
jgi:hypothetical protein